jgi:hypothetical protein
LDGGEAISEKWYGMKVIRKKMKDVGHRQWRLTWKTAVFEDVNEQMGMEKFT